MAVNKIKLSMDDLTLGDLEAFEDAVGGDLMEVLEPQVVRDENGRPVRDPDDPKGRPLRQVKVSAKTMVGLVYIALKKENPDLTVEEVKRMPITELDFDLGSADDVDPTEPQSGDENESNDV